MITRKQLSIFRRLFNIERTPTGYTGCCKVCGSTVIINKDVFTHEDFGNIIENYKAAHPRMYYLLIYHKSAEVGS